MFRNPRSSIRVDAGTHTPRRSCGIHGALVTLATTLTLLNIDGSAQTRHYPLVSTAGLRLVNATAEPATLNGKKGLRVTEKLPAQTSQSPEAQRTTGKALVVVEGTEFTNGVIEAEIAGAPAPGAPETARGFVGIAFRVQNDLGAFEQFYLRPTNGRADDQERRNHAVQYSSYPDWLFFRTRKETPSKYEAYVDLVPELVGEPNAIDGQAGLLESAQLDSKARVCPDLRRRCGVHEERGAGGVIHVTVGINDPADRQFGNPPKGVVCLCPPGPSASGIDHDDSCVSDDHAQRGITVADCRVDAGGHVNDVWIEFGAPGFELSRCRALLGTTVAGEQDEKAHGV